MPRTTWPKWAESVRRALQSLRPIDSKDIKHEFTGGGVRSYFNRTVGVGGGGGGGTVITGVGGVICKVTSGSGHVYVVDVYANGVDQPATAANQALWVMQLGYGESGLAGTYVIAATTSLPIYNDLAV